MAEGGRGMKGRGSAMNAGSVGDPRGPGDPKVADDPMAHGDLDVRGDTGGTRLHDDRGDASAPSAIPAQSSPVGQPRPAVDGATVALEAPACDRCGGRDAAALIPPGTWGPPLPPQLAMRRCRSCGLVYLSPRPTREAIGAFYPPDYQPYRRAVEDEPWALMRLMRRRKLADRRRLVERYRGEGAPGRVLDVGCSTGLFLHEMALAGWEAEGVELSPEAADYARRRFGLRVQTGMLEDAQLAPGSFDLVTFWDVLEHVYSPTDTLARAATLLKPGGLVVVHVPNWDSPERRLFGRHWAGWDPPRHLYVFDRASLGGLLQGAGFQVLDWVCFMPAYFTWLISLEHALETHAPRLRAPLIRLLRLPGLRLPLEPAFWLLNRLGRGSVIAAVARREVGPQ